MTNDLIHDVTKQQDMMKRTLENVTLKLRDAVEIEKLNPTGE